MLRGAILGALALLALASTAPAHGGRYRGPADEVDPSARQEFDPTLPQGGDALPPSYPSPEGAPRFPLPKFESWRFWWHFNEESLLDAPGPGAPLDAALVEERIVPLLDGLARGLAPPHPNLGHQRELQSAAILGLARLGRAERIPVLLQAAKDAEKQGPVMARESVCLALGLMGRRSPEVLRFLRTQAADASERWARVRCNAMFSLGLLGGPGAGPDPESLAILRGVVLEESASWDIRPSALLGIGLLGDPGAVPDLLRWLREGRVGAETLKDVEVAYVAAALGKIGAPGLPGGSGREVVDALGALLRSNRPLPRWSAAIALGRIGAVGDAETATACAALLRAAIAEEAWTTRGPQTAQFAIASLGRIASGTARTSAERDAILQTLAGVLREGAEGPRAFAALALAVGGRRLEGEARERVAVALREAVSRSGGSAESAGAAIVALGLLRDASSARLLRGMLESTVGDPRLRADAALALGLLGDPWAVPGLRKALEQRQRNDLRYQASLALGLLRDRGAVEPLLGVLGNIKSGTVRLGAAARALGWIGDPGAVDRLIALTGDPDVNECERSAAVVALARLASGGKDDDLARLSEDVNYRASCYALSQVLRLL